MVELGLAIAWEKPVFLVRDDFRCCIDSEGYPLNRMLFTGLPEMGWDAYWYSSAQEIADPDKVPSRWLKDGVLPGIISARQTRPDHVTPYSGRRAQSLCPGAGRCTPPR